MVRLSIVCSIFCVAPLIAVMPGPGFENELCTLDAGIDELTNLKEVELARADRYATSAQKAEKRHTTDADKYWTMYYNAKDIAARYDHQILVLKERRARLLTYNGLDPNTYKKPRSFCK